ncbi:MAG: response regulator [Elainellaceae cyanobacterium]
MRILLVEDDEILTDVLVQSLTQQRYAVDTAEDGVLGWDYVEQGSYDLLLIDVGLPRLDGISLCQRLRAEGYAVPILLMTAKDAPEERIRGLDAGADDYLTKPLDLGELQARVRALLRRGEVTPDPILELGALRLNPVNFEVTYSDKPLKLTPKEYSLLELFLRNPSRVFSRGQIVEHLWTFDDPPLEDSVKAHIKGLRRKMKNAGATDWIENVYGLGYRLNTEAANASAQKTDDKKTAVEAATATQFTTNAQTGTEQAFDQAMGALWQQYEGLMIERLDALQTAASAIQSHSLTLEIKQTAEKAAHKLAGVLGMFGKEDGTQLARQLESLLEAGTDLETKTDDRLQQVPELVQQLARSLNLGAAPASDSSQPPLPSLEPQLLLISTDLKLGVALQQITPATEFGWKPVTTIADAKAWLQTHDTELVVLDLEDSKQFDQGLALLAELASRTPAIPAVVLTSLDALSDRIRIASTGAQGLLKKPVTASQIWAVGSQLLQRSRTQAVRVLAVDDDPILLQTVRLMLEPWGMRVTTLDDPSRFWEVLNATVPNLLILDVEMPAFNGIELCQAVRTDPNWQDLPIIFLTAHRDARTVEQVFTAGADDYVTKPILGPELLTRITNRLERARLLQTLSSREPKTGLANQAQSQRDLEALLQESQAPVALVLLNLTDLRQINAQYGHTSGNQVLKRWGDILRTAFRAGEVVGYWDNGEFVIGIPGVQQEQAIDRLSAVLATLRKQIFTAPNGQRFQVSYAIGVSEFLKQGNNIQELYQAASAAI